MAFIDYGCIVFKNGKIISKSTYFNNMKEMVGWSDEGTETPIYDGYDGKTEYTFQMDGNCFGYIGDEDLTIGFYKDVIYVYEKNCWNATDKNPGVTAIYPNWTDYTWSKWEKSFYTDSPFKMWKAKVTKRNGYLVFKTTYRGDKYKVYFGYGVDLDCYKKYHIVNYYRAPWVLVRNFFNYTIPDFMEDVKWKFRRRFGK